MQKNSIVKMVTVILVVLSICYLPKVNAGTPVEQVQIGLLKNPKLSIWIGPDVKDIVLSDLEKLSSIQLEKTTKSFDRFFETEDSNGGAIVQWLNRRIKDILYIDIDVPERAEAIRPHLVLVYPKYTGQTFWFHRLATLIHEARHLAAPLPHKSPLDRAIGHIPCHANSEEPGKRNCDNSDSGPVGYQIEFLTNLGKYCRFGCEWDERYFALSKARQLIGRLPQKHQSKHETVIDNAMAELFNNRY